MRNTIIPCLLLSGAACQADILTSTQSFFGLGGQTPNYTEEEDFSIPGVQEAPFSPADSDLGIQEILVSPAVRSPVVFDIRTDILRTDNAPSPNRATDEASWYSSSRASLSWRQHISNGWFADIGVYQDFLRFDDSNATDYENLTTRLGVYRYFPDFDDTVFFATYEFQRLTTGSVSDGDYNAQRIRAGLQKSLWAIPGQRLSTSLYGAYEWTARPETLQRNQVGIDLYYRYSFTDRIYALASARTSYFNYDDLGRSDWAYEFGTQLVWQISRRIQANASVYYNKNDSNSFGGFADYEAWTGGLGLGFQMTF